MADTNTKGEKFLCVSSKENITPDMGALKAAESPALAPLVIKYFFSLSSLLVFLDKPSPTQAPI